ncbi:MAG: hypothetical protein ACPIOQ_68515, partial [Promethearchaeia archaeon]
KFTQVRSKEGSYFKVHGKNGYNFDVALGDYKADVQIAMYVAHKNGSQLFTINKDKTISPAKSPNLVWGIGPNRELILVDAIDVQRRLLFKDLRPTQFNVVKSFKLALGSHKGKGIDRRNVIDHFMPPGAPQQPRFTYRLEKVRHRPGRVREGQTPSPD